MRPMLLICLVLSCPAFAGDYVWWEGETPERTNFPADRVFSADTFTDKRQLLSDGNWLSISGRRGAEEPFATYSITVPAAGRYQLWARKFWKHGPFRWRFDEQPYQVCSREVALADNIDLRLHLGANWVYLGEVQLEAGGHAFELRLIAEPGDNLVAAFDCFILTPGLFLPNGKLKPGERSNQADEGFFAYEPGLDEFADRAVLDLRHLNEKTAGEKGFVGKAGDQLLLGDGRAVRFWGVNVSANNAGQSHASVDYLARKLAKLGVNLVRFHSPLFEGPGLSPISPRKLDDLHYLVAAMKKEGIYTAISFYYPLWLELNHDPEFPGYDTTQNKHPYVLLYFDGQFQDHYKQWLKDILTAPNPYTHQPLAREPAVALIELVNEDSFFFWTFTHANVPSPHWQELERQFAAWLIARYGAIDKAYAAWGAARMGEDRPDRPAILEAWHMTGEGQRRGGAGKERRMADQIAFLAQLQRGFYARMVRYVHDELGSPSLVTCSNWKTTDPARLDAVERHTYTAGDVLDAHGYFQGRHEGEGSEYSVRVGQRFDSAATVRNPERFPLLPRPAADLPQVFSEVGFPLPNRYRADAVLLCAAEAARQGVDGLFFFAMENNFVHPGGIGKFSLAGPTMAGAFPATALLYRRGDVDQGAQPHWDPAAGLFTLKTPRAQAVAGFLAKAGPIDLPLATIECRNEFASLCLIALDDEPLDRSHKILIQALTEEQPYGFKTQGDQITDLGSTPTGLRRLDATLQLKLPGPARRLTILDENGYPAAKPTEVNAAHLALPPDAIYLLLESP